MNLITRILGGAAALLAAGSILAAEPQSLQKEGGTAPPYAGNNVVITSGNSATITNGPGEYGAVYTKSNLIKYLKGKVVAIPISRVEYSFQSSGTVAGGAPRFSIPIDINGDDVTDGYAFLDVNGCGGSGYVSTKSGSCKVSFNAATYDNWAQFVATNPTYTVNSVPFIISDQPGNYVITNIDVK